VRGAASGRLVYALGAGALYAAAVLSKEHALLLPAVALVAIGRPSRDRAYYRYAAAYLAVCVPVAITAVLFLKGVIGERYEPDFGEVAAQIAPNASEAPTHAWAGSIVAQAALFFRYLAQWVWPRTSAMAVDLRVDFAELWRPWVAVTASLAFAAWGAIGLWAVVRGRGAAALAAVGMLWLWLLFLVEFSTIRFQEPFVLYRSYLWAPGIAIIVVAALQRVRVRVAIAMSVCMAVILAAQAYDRLQSLSSGLAIWEDAAAKLPAKPVPGGSRTLYQLGREYLAAGEPERAVAVIERCLHEYPDAFQCPFARAAIHLRLEQYEEAIPYLRRARELRPDEGVAAHHLGLALEQLGCRDQARAYYELAGRLGFGGAVHRIKALDSPGQGLLPPARAKSAPAFKCPA
jgi:tetratricopeptide (TPR) repeat protein